MPGVRVFSRPAISGGGGGSSGAPSAAAADVVAQLLSAEQQPRPVSMMGNAPSADEGIDTTPGTGEELGRAPDIEIAALATRPGRVSEDRGDPLGDALERVLADLDAQSTHRLRTSEVLSMLGMSP